MLRSYRLFISHAWTHNDAYYRLTSLLDQAPYFLYHNYSVPEHDPLVPPGSPIADAILMSRLERQIAPVQCVVVLSGMYAAHRYWIDQEIRIAKRYRKPIIGLCPWGQERTPVLVQEAADEMVSWSTSSIVAAIRRHSI